MALFFPSFLDKPDKFSFKDQEVDETIELLLRRHWVTNVPWILLSLLGYLIPIFVIPNLSFLNLPFSISQNLIISLTLLWYLGLFGFILVNFFSWYFNIYLLTNKHIIDISLDSILSSSVTANDYVDIESTQYQFKGVLGPLFRYGDVTSETAAKDQSIDFAAVPNPDVVAARIEALEGNKKGGE